jgi:zinc and cadmium transporter
MASTVFLALASTVLVSLISVFVIIPFLFRKKTTKGLLLFLLSFSVGVLLATVFTDLIPETFSHEYNVKSALYILGGFLLMFIIEKIVHFHHSKQCEEKESGHAHAYSLAPINLIGDGFHNFIDGLVIAGAYIVNIHVGISATIAIIFHEIPQEIADVGVLLYSGISKLKALLFNFLSACFAIAGTIIGLVFANKSAAFASFIIPFAAGNFIYIAASNLLPQLHRECKWKATLVHIFAIVLGIGLMVLLDVYGPTHHH